MAFEGFSYNIDKRDDKTGKRYWRCENRICKGRMITAKDDRILKETAHNVHGPDVPAMEVSRSLARVREAALCTRDAPAEIVNEELNSQLPKEYRGYWANEPSMKRTIQRIRRKHLPEIPKSLQEVNIPEQWQKNSRGEQWMLCDLSGDEGNGRLIILCTERNLQYLSYSNVWYGDGTFSVCPTFFTSYTPSTV